MPRHGYLVPLALLLLIGVLWGGFYSLIKISVTGGVHPMNYLFWFTLGSAVCLCGACLARGRWPVLERAHLGYYLKIGFVRFTLANIILYSVQAKLPVGLMAVIMTFVPIFTYGLSLIARIERFVWARMAGILAGFAGVLLIVVPRAAACPIRRSRSGSWWASARRCCTRWPMWRCPNTRAPLGWIR